jgi:hypothetical protein
MDMYLVFSVITSTPTSLLASIKVCVFLFMVYILPPSEPQMRHDTKTYWLADRQSYVTLNLQ